MRTEMAHRDWRTWRPIAYRGCQHANRIINTLIAAFARLAAWRNSQRSPDTLAEFAREETKEGLGRKEERQEGRAKGRRKGREGKEKANSRTERRGHHALPEPLNSDDDTRLY